MRRKFPFTLKRWADSTDVLDEEGDVIVTLPGKVTAEQAAPVVQRIDNAWARGFDSGRETMARDLRRLLLVDEALATVRDDIDRLRVEVKL